MKLSARNQIAGTIKAVKPGATTSHVTIEVVSPTVTITASITNEAAGGTGFEAGHDGLRGDQGIRRDGRHLITRSPPRPEDPMAAVRRETTLCWRTAME